MLTLIALGLALAAPPEPSSSLPFVRGLDAPAGKVVRQIGTNEGMVSPRPIVRKCVAFAAHAAVWTEDPSQKGVQDLELRARPSGWAPEKVCVPTLAGARRIPANDQIFDPVGAVGRHLVTLYPDGLGVLSAFSIVDMDTGARVLGDEFNVAKGIDLARSGGDVTVSWWSNVGDVPCVPRRGESACWLRILAAKKVPSRPRIPAPDCEPILKRRPEAAAEGSVQITIHARTTLGRDGIEFLGDPATCDEAE
jgi:hypothetical protein